MHDEQRLAFAVMAKAPQLGRVKTRLVPPLTPEQAMQLGESFLVDSIAVVRAVANIAPIQPYVAYMPVGSEALMRTIVGDDVDFVLADGALIDDPGVTGIGRSLLHATRSLLGQDHLGVCLISADSPSLPTAVLAEAAALLARPGDRLVLGPAEDGGYYLIGLKAAHAVIFQDIHWSTEIVAAETRARAASIGLECAMLPSWYDIDDQAALTRLSVALATGAEAAPCSALALQRFGLAA
jgi:rSAM/selenodomain-associated transferase 1